MPSTFSLSFRLELQASGENLNSWGQRLNVALQLVEQATAGRLALAVSAPVTLTSSNAAVDQARNAMLDLTGTGGTITIPAVSKLYVVRNAGTGSMVLSTGGATTATVEAGESAWVMCDGAAVRVVRRVTFGGERVRKVGAPTQPDDAATKAYVDSSSFTAAAGNLPGQTGNASKVLGTDGTTASWVGKSFLALDLVDNVRDADKPINAAHLAALNGKLDKAGGTLAGSLITLGTNEVATAFPYFQFKDTDGLLEKKFARLVFDADRLEFQTVNDAYTVASRRFAAGVTTFTIDTGLTVAGSTKLIGATELNSDMSLVGLSPTIRFVDTDGRGAFLHNNNNIFYILGGAEATNSTTFAQVNGRWALEINLDTNFATFGGGANFLGSVVASGHVYADTVLNGSRGFFLREAGVDRAGFHIDALNDISYLDSHGTLNVRNQNAAFAPMATLTQTLAAFPGGVRAGGDISVVNVEPTIRFLDTDGRGAFLHNNSNSFYILGGLEVTNSTTWARVNGRWALEINLDTNFAIFGGGGDFLGNFTTPGLATVGVRTGFKGGIGEALVVLGTSGTVNVDSNAGSYFLSGPVTAALTFTFSAPPAGFGAQSFTIRVVNGAAFVVTWPADVRWPGGVAPALSTAGSDYLTFTRDNQEPVWRGILSAKGYS